VFTTSRSSLKACRSGFVRCLPDHPDDQSGKSIEPPPQVVEQHEPCEPDWCVAESEWREIFYTCPSLESDTSQEAKRKAFRRAVDDLLKLDRVRGSHGYFWPIG